jgi:hypothetical protein
MGLCLCVPVVAFLLIEEPLVGQRRRAGGASRGRSRRPLSARGGGVGRPRHPWRSQPPYFDGAASGDGGQSGQAGAGDHVELPPGSSSGMAAVPSQPP